MRKVASGSVAAVSGGVIRADLRLVLEHGPSHDPHLRFPVSEMALVTVGASSSLHVPECEQDKTQTKLHYQIFQTTEGKNFLRCVHASL